MLAVDTSTFAAFLAGLEGRDVALLDAALADQTVVLPPAVLAELWSAPHLEPAVAALFADLPTLTLSDGYWQRVGKLRAEALRRGRRARLADALIAQSCLDHDVPLCTRDADFRGFAGRGLMVVP